MKLFLTLILVCLFTFNIKAINNYQVIDYINNIVLANFNDINQALDYYEDIIKTNQHIAVKNNGKIIKIKYAIAKLKTDNDCLYHINYTDLKTKQTGSFNACFASDAAYIDSDFNSKKIIIKLSGVNMELSQDDVELIPFNENSIKPSVYLKKNQNFYHHIKTQLELDYFGRVLNLYLSPEEIIENKEYFSYDGNYFYDSFYSMIDDYRLNTNDNAVNKKAYFNYYQYTPHRSLSNYNFKDLDFYLYKSGINSKINKYLDLDYDGVNDIVNQSQLFEETKNFFDNQYIYGTNALMLFSTAVKESSFGRSLESFEKNNLYMDAAFESDKELLDNRYNNLAESIYAHSKYYLSSFYFDINNKNYSGSHFGNKLSGINKNKSEDPYWGEELASVYATIDSSLGFKDLNSYTLGIINDKSINFYSDENLTDHLFNLKNINYYPLIILKEFKKSYLVQLDTSLFNNDSYDFSINVAYINKDSFEEIINKNRISIKKYFDVVFDALNGSYKNSNKIKVSLAENSFPSISDPYFDGYEFMGYDKKIKEVLNDETYYAQYQKIIDFNVINNIKVNGYNQLDLSDLKLVLKLEDGTIINKKVSSNMLVFDDDIFKLKKIKIKYSGFEKEININFSFDYNNKLNRFLKLKKLLNDKQINLKDALELKFLVKYGFNLDYEEIKILDLIIYNFNNKFFDYVIDKNHLDLSISGLSLIDDSISEKFLIKDVIKVKIKKTIDDRLKFYQQIIKDRGYNLYEEINLSFYKNYNLIKLNTDLVINLKVDDQKNRIYRIFYVDENNNLIEIKTKRTSNYIKFLSRYNGNFLIAYKESANIYNINDKIENIDHLNSDINKTDFILITNLFVLIISFICIFVVIKIRRNNGKITKDNSI